MDIAKLISFSATLRRTKALDFDARLPWALYFHDGLVVTVHWKKENPKQAFVRFSVPDTDDRDRHQLA